MAEASREDGIKNTLKRDVRPSRLFLDDNVGIAAPPVENWKLYLSEDAISSVLNNLFFE